MAQRSRLHPGKPVAAAGAATGDRVVVLNEPAAEAGEDGGAVGEARAVHAAIAAAASFCEIPRKVSPAFAGRSHCNWV